MLKRGTLTKDHIPPKSCGNKGKGTITYEHVFYNQSQEPQSKKHILQNGVSFKTICEKCNNELLGANYDKELERICKKAILQLKFVRNTINIKCKINKLCRDICAKFLAMNPSTEEKGIEGQIRKYVLNEKQKNISDSHLYIRVYPYKEYIFFARNQLPMGREHFLKIISELSFFPFSFLLTTDMSDKEGWASIEKMDYNFIDLFKFTTENIDDEVEISILVSSMIDKFTKKPFSPSFPLDKYGILLGVVDNSMEANAIIDNKN